MAVDLTASVPSPVISQASGEAEALTVIVPPYGWDGAKFIELWAYRELIWFFVWRDVKVRYKQTVLGAGWAIIQPVLTTVVFTIFLGRLARVPSDGIPYPLFSFAALVPWTLFAFGLTQATNSVVGSQHLITKVFFPRLAIPLAAVLSGLLDFALAFALLLVVMLWFGVEPTRHLLWVPLLTVLTLITALGAGFWLAALNVHYRDVRYVLPFLTQLWLFATPIAYPSSLLSERWRTVYGINPMAGVVEGFRWALLGVGNDPAALIAVSTVVSVLLLVSGGLYFHRMESSFADIV
jgi:lipopolysaccharide transport system permease protein